MFRFGPKDKDKDKDKKVNSKVDDLNKVLNGQELSSSLDSNVNALKKLFTDNDTVVFRNLGNNHDDSLKFCLAYFDGSVNSSIMNENLIRPLMLADTITSGENIIDTLLNKVVMINEAKKTKNIQEIIKSITYGDTVLLVDGASEALVLNTKGFETRSVDEPDNEKVLSGPREGFTESIVKNLSLVRRKLRTNELKMKYYAMGKRSNTQICVCYIDSIVNKEILNELYKRLDTIEIDAILDANYITELIKDNPYSPFRTTGYTERPDVVVGKILEGRIAIFVDGSPIVLTVPYLFIENFQSSEDYYLSFYYTSLSRFLRIAAFYLTISIPALYISVVAFHHEMIPTPLLINLAAERNNVPFPAAVEAFIMLVAFDILRETGVRMPSNIGQALSIVGALVIGQAAVEAKLVAGPMIIVIATTGITSLLVPKMNAPVIWLRLIFFLAASTLGFYGLLLAQSAALIHMINLRSCGVPMMSLSGDFSIQNIKDIFIRAPWWMMTDRTPDIAEDIVRMKPKKGGN